MEYGFADILELLGSLGLFLFGMMMMSDYLLKIAGSKMRSFLARMTSNYPLGIFTGFLITTVIQSSSATTLMVVSFSNAALLTLTESISVIMGANIGTTVTAWLITVLGFKVSMSKIALPLIGLGFAMTFAKKENIKNWGVFIIGFSLLFMGLDFLKGAMPDINKNPGMLSFLQGYTQMGYFSILIFLLIGTILTIIVQSSSATMAITLIMCAQGWIPFEMAAAMILGENIGTTITANIAAIVSNYKAKRTARAHLVFNLIGVIWMLIVFYPFLDLIDWVTGQMGSESPYTDAAAVPVAISLFHTIFNVLNTFLLVWFIGPISRFVIRLVPVKISAVEDIAEPKYLSEEVLNYPETAIAAIEKESEVLFEQTVLPLIAQAMSVEKEDLESKAKMKEALKSTDLNFLDDLQSIYNKKVQGIYGKILNYITKAQSLFLLTEDQIERLSKVRLANRNMVEIVKHVGDLTQNISKYMFSENSHINHEYGRLRKKIVKAIRVSYRTKVEGITTKFQKKISDLPELFEEKRQLEETRIDRLIRKDMIDDKMSSSLVSDYETVNEIVFKLLTVTSLLFDNKDILLESDNKRERVQTHDADELALSAS